MPRLRHDFAAFTIGAAACVAALGPLIRIFGHRHTAPAIAVSGAATVLALRVSAALVTRAAVLRADARTVRELR